MILLKEYLLSTMIFLPLVFALLTFLTPGGGAKWVSMAGSLLTLLLGVCLWTHFDGAAQGLQFVEAYEWIPSLGIKYIVGVDGISLLLVVFTTILMPLIFLQQWDIDDSRQKNFLTLLLALESAMVGSLVALDLVFFYVFWEAMLIPMYFIIGVWGGKRRIYAATKFVLYTVIGSLLMLAAGIYLYVLYYQQTGVYSTSLLDLYQVRSTMSAQVWMFLAFLLAFAIKVPMWPFHTWLPDAHVEAPTVGSVILAGILLKMGTYGMLRFVIPLFPMALQEFAPFLLFLAVVGIIYGALTAWVQGDAKKMVAYSSVSHLGFVVLGSFALLKGGQEISVEALTGAIYQMINHGVSTGALFFLVGCIYDRRHTRQLDDFGGLAEAMPWFAVLLIVATLSSVGLPGTGGFVGEFLILLGTFQANPFAAILGGSGVLLGAIYMLTLCRKILFGPCDKPENKELKDLSAREFGYLVPLAFLIIVMGIFPSYFLDRVKPSVEFLARHFTEYKLLVEHPSEHNGQLDIARRAGKGD